ncbi:MAG TPA: SDR family NAD(P)-dependent oxidoreductase [Ramlibacter sp.]|nr:SDR family NAD(P)-dependent oxidoreductase [Ramlibacter sp.]
MPDLKECIAVVTGATRGAGRGIAVELGAAGATVYVTGRSTRARPARTYGQILSLSKMESLPGSIEATADEVTAAGGRGIPVRCDHAREEDVVALFERVEREHGRLDLLVNNAWGGHEVFDGVFQAPFWERTMEQWDPMMNRGVRNHLLASRIAAPLMIRRRQGLIVTTTFWDRHHYMEGNLFYDLAKSAMTRLAFGMAQELRPHGVASVAVSPGWMRTESPRYLGRAVAALAADPKVHARTGEVLRVADLARTYGFTDIDGRQVPPFELDAH